MNYILCYRKLLSLDRNCLSDQKTNLYNISVRCTKKMSRFSRDSKFRIRDFQSRSNKNVYLNKHINQKYIPIHPFACEIGILENLDIKPENCTSVDAYWNMGKDISFLQVMSEREFDTKETGLYLRWGKSKGEYLNLVAIVDSSTITRELFEKIMLKFVKLKVKPSEKNRRYYPKNLKFIGNIS